MQNRVRPYLIYVNYQRRITMEIKCRYDEMVDTCDLLPYEKNNKKHPDDQIALLAKGIRNFGFRWPIAANKKTKKIISGHARLQAASLLNMDKVPVVWHEFKSAAEEKAFRIADNKLASRAEDDFRNIVSEIQDLDTGEIDLELTGYLEDEIAQIMSSIPEMGEEKDGESGEGKTVTCPKCKHVFDPKQ